MSTSESSTYQYDIGGSLPVNSPTYVTRQADEDLYLGLKTGQFCYVLNSRQMGKSSLRVRTMQRLQAEGFGCAAIDITAIGTSDIPPEEWYASLIDSIVSSLDLYDTFDLDSWWSNNSRLTNIKRLSKFIEEVLLSQTSQNLVIFVDEIDSTLSLNFKVDDFFALLRACYNQRVDKPSYNRLTFCLLGVASPSNLIEDKKRTPFNIGQAIALYGFGVHEIEPLRKGLLGKVSDPQAVMREILSWTGGQPFLTQKLCKLMELESAEDNSPSVEQVVRARVIENWQSQDEPEHLKTIRDRLLMNEKKASRLLGLYQQVLQAEEQGTEASLASDDSPEQMELRLTGLVVKREGTLRVTNPIYQQVFNKSWVEKELNNLRPYSENFNAWITSECQDESRLLRGQALKEALTWVAGKSLSNSDYQFLSASQSVEKQAIELERMEAEINLEAERKQREAAEKAKQILTTANKEATLAKKKAERRVAIGSVFLAISLVGGVTIAGIANKLLQEAQIGTKLEQQGVNILRRFESGSGEIDMLLEAMQTGQKLYEIVKDGRPLKEYPAISPLYTLRTILDNIHQRNQLEGHQYKVKSVVFSPDSQLLATASWDKTARVWDRAGNLVTELKGYQSGVKSLVFSPDSKLLATASGDKTARVWDRAGNLVTELKGHQNGVNSVVFSPDSQLLATASWDKTARVWDRAGNLVTELKGHQSGVKSVVFSPDSQLLATTSRDNTARVWDRAGNLVTELKGHQDSVNRVVFSPDSKLLATASRDNTARVWDRAGNLVTELKGHQDQVYRVVFSPDSKLLATASRDNTARVWDRAGNLVTELKGHQDRVNSVVFSPDSKLLATASRDNTARVWRVEGLDELLARGCEWLDDYLKTHPKDLERLPVCQDESILSARGLYLVTEGEKIARTGNFDEAVATFRKAQEWNPDLDFDPEAKASIALVKKGVELVKDGKVKEAIAAYNKAQNLDRTLVISAKSWNELCWFGSLHAYPAEVIFACEKAVALEPEHGGIRDSRGLARALTGDTAGAIEDFQAVLELSGGRAKEKRQLKRQLWIDALRKGENPFTAEEIKSLFDE
ncbi:MAG: AAA-like domain-containing protein [Xenococcaceae cyanobacterium]